jgi:hypothetical protein
LLLSSAICGAADSSADATGKASGFAAPADESSQFEAAAVVSGLDNPWGLAVRPGAPTEGPWELFISESGAGRVVNWTIGSGTSSATPAITDFPTRTFSQRGAYRVGPLGLDFLTRSKLAVGTGGLGEGKDTVQVYVLPEVGGTLKYDAVDHAVGPVVANTQYKTGLGAFLCLANTEDALFATGSGDDTGGWILKASLNANRLADLQRFIAPRQTTGVDAPTAVVVNPKPSYHYLVVGQQGSGGNVRDSRLCFFSPKSGILAMTLPIGLYDVAGLAYSPAGDLYAVDFAADNDNAGGVYRIDAAIVDGQESCRPVKIAAAVHPTALVFAPDGALYVSALGNRAEATKPATGTILKLTPRSGTPPL